METMDSILNVGLKYCGDLDKGKKCYELYESEHFRHTRTSA